MTAKQLITGNWLPLAAGDEKAGSRHLLRRTFTLRDVPGGAAVSITAGSIYRLYINGKPVMAGPARSAGNIFFFDTVDIGGFLLPGDNSIAVETAFFPNNVPETIQYEFAVHEPGIGICLEFPSQVGPAVFDSTWRILPLDCFDPDAVWSRGLVSEFVYARGLPGPSWTEAGFDDSRWTQVDPDSVTAAPVEIRERPTPLPLIQNRKPVRLTDSGFFLHPRGGLKSVDPGEFFWFGNRKDKAAPAEIKDLDRVQYRKVCRSVSGGQWTLGGSGLLGNGSCGALSLSGKSGLSGYVTYDFGRIIPGTPFIEAEIPEGVRLDVSLMEWLNDETGSPGEGKGRVCGVMVGAGGFTVIGDGRRIRFESIQQHNARYMCITPRGVTENGKVLIHDAGITEICAIKPSDCTADAVCSDPVINRIIEAAKETVRVNAHDYYVDCTCERIVTSGDCLQASTAGRLFYGGTGRAVSETMFDLFLEQGLSEIPDWSRTPRGRCCAGTRKDSRSVWMLAAAMLVLDVLAWRAEQPSDNMPEKYASFIKGIAQDIELHLCREGLVEADSLTHNWNDWSKMAVGPPDEEYTGISISTNAFFYRMFRELRDAFPDEELYGKLEHSIIEGIRNLIDPWLNSTGPRVGRFVPDLFIRTDGILKPFEVKEANVFGGSAQVVSEAAQYWLLWSGVLDGEREARLWDVLRGWRSFRIPARDNTRMINPSRVSSIMGLFPRFAFLRERFDPVIYRDARDAFGPAAAAGGTLWEGLEQDSRSAAHATSAYAGTLLYESLTGILPGTAGAAVTIAPIVDDSIEWARGYKQTERGVIGVNWRRGENTFTLCVGLPPALRARVRLPASVLGELTARGHAVPECGIIEIGGSVEITAGRFSGLRITELP